MEGKDTVLGKVTDEARRIINESIFVCISFWILDSDWSLPRTQYGVGMTTFGAVTPAKEIFKDGLIITMNVIPT